MTDPLIEQARFINDNARMERNLAERKAKRSDPHARGWMTRRAMGRV